MAISNWHLVKLNIGTLMSNNVGRGRQRTFKNHFVTLHLRVEETKTMTASCDRRLLDVAMLSSGSKYDEVKVLVIQSMLFKFSFLFL